MITLSQYFKQQRHKLKISPQRASDDTGIKLSYLKELEGESETNNVTFESSIYRYGFIKKYSSYLGLDPEYAIALDRRENGEKVKSYVKTFNPNPSKSIYNIFKLKYFLAIIFAISTVLLFSYIYNQYKLATEYPDISLFTPVNVSIQNNSDTHEAQRKVDMNAGSFSIKGKTNTKNSIVKINNSIIKINTLGEFVIQDLIIEKSEIKLYTIEIENISGRKQTIKIQITGI